MTTEGEVARRLRGEGRVAHSGLAGRYPVLSGPRATVAVVRRR